MSQVLRDVYDGCVYCGESSQEVAGRALFVEGGHPLGDSRIRQIVLDHVHPISEGGSNALDNLAPACWGCNSIKGSRDLENFRAYVAWRTWSDENAGLRSFSKDQMAFLESRFGIDEEQLGIREVVFFYESKRKCEPLVRLSRRYGTGFAEAAA